MFIFYFLSLQWVLDKQDLMKERQKDLKYLSEEEYWKLQIFFANGICLLRKKKIRRQYHIVVLSYLCEA